MNNVEIKKYNIKSYAELLEKVILVFDFDLKSEYVYNDFKENAFRSNNRPDSKIFYGVKFEKQDTNFPVIPLTEKILKVYGKTFDSFEKDWNYYQLKTGLALGY